MQQMEIDEAPDVVSPTDELTELSETQSNCSS